MARNDLAEALRRREPQRDLPTAIRLAQENLLRLQCDDGYWVGELVVDATLCADYILFMHWAEEVDARTWAA